MRRDLIMEAEAILVKIVSLVEDAAGGISINELSKALGVSYLVTMGALNLLFAKRVLTVDSFQIVRLVGAYYSDYHGCDVLVRFCPHCKSFTTQAINEAGGWSCLCCQKLT
ncbi:hypothetical protein COT51_03990, partial [candidate division WWE3 bacterium CG08_land_8_20_14_0_20_41_15]